MADTLTNGQLRRKIAVLHLGWRLVSPQRGGWYVFCPVRTAADTPEHIIMEQIQGHATPDEAWQTAFAYHPVPDWPADLNVALRDLKMPVGATLTQMADGWRASPETPNSTAVTRERPAEAWCRAWIYYKTQNPV